MSKTTISLTKLKNRLHEILEAGKGSDFLSKFIDVLLMTLVLSSVVAVVLESVPEIEEVYSHQFRLFEIFCISTFTIEYLLRLWTAPLKFPESKKPYLKYFFSFYGLIDVCAIIPFYLSLFTTGIDLRILRVVRILRIIKISHYNTALQDLWDAIYDERKSFISASYIFSVALLICASLAYYAENTVQPEEFKSIPHAIWWALITLTTVGYGDVSPITFFGKIVGIFTALMGVCTVALLTGIVANSFSAQLSRKKSVFRAEVIKALQDGIITQEEREGLKRLRDEFNLSRQHADAIFEEAFEVHQQKTHRDQALS
jgi:voltage-gated potassium channel